MEALSPNVFTMVEELKEDQAEVSEEIAKKNEIIELFKRPGWKLIEEYVETSIERVRDYQIGKEDTMEMIGFKEMASRVASNALQGILTIKELALLDEKSRERD